MARLRLGWNILLTGWLTIVLPAAAIAQPRIYTPIPIKPGQPISDILTRNDIPTGQGGFARDYVVTLQAGSQVTLEVASPAFDSLVYLIDLNGLTIAENDDGPDGSTNSRLSTRITQTGTYIIRVRSIGATTTGSFTLRVAVLKSL